MNKREKIIIMTAAGVAFIVFIISISLMVSMLMKNEQKWKKDISSTIKDNTEGKEGERKEINIKDIEKDNSVHDRDKHIQYSKNDGSGNVMSDGEAEAILNGVNNHLHSFKFKEAYDYAVEEVSKYDTVDSSGFENIKDIYRDLSTMYSILEVSKQGDDDLILNMARDLNDLDSLFYLGLWLDADLRSDLIIKEDSLNPMYIRSVKSLSSKLIDEDDDIYNDAKRIFSSIDKIKKYNFKVDEDSLKAYIVKSNNKVYFYTIDWDGEEGEGYFTVREWREMQMEAEEKWNY